MSKFKNLLRWLVIVILLITSITLIFWNQIRAYMTNQVNDKIITAYQEDKSDVEINWWEKYLSEGKQDNIKITDNMLGIINVPSVNISEPIFREATEQHLIDGVATVLAEDKTGLLDEQNVAIAGHSVQGVGIRFNNLLKIKEGDEVQIVTKEGMKKYKVYKIYNVGPSQIEEAYNHPGEPQEVTLITCTSYNSSTDVWEERMIVKAKIVE